MLDHLKTERPSTAAQSRLWTYMAGLLVLAAGVVGFSTCGGQQGPDELPTVAAANPEVKPAPPAVLHVERLPAADDDATHARYDPQGLEYLLGVVDRDWVARVRRIDAGTLAALPFEEARGGVFEVEGRVLSLTREVYRTDTQRLWSVVLEGPDGHRFIVLKHGYATDSEEGRPDTAQASSMEYVTEGDSLLVRGIYLQRRTGSQGGAIFREPVPVLVATPPVAAFRLLPAERAPPIQEPQDASWEMVEDRFLADTKRWDEPALFEMLAWAREKGHAAILEDIQSGALTSESWGRDMFGKWKDEVEVDQANAPRPVTTGARGKLFRTTGLLESFVREGWYSVPRSGSQWGVDTLYVLDMASDHYGNKGIRTFCAFPLETFEGVTGRRHQPVTAYGFFLKNYTYETWQKRDGEPGLLTMPMFIVVHIDPILPAPSAYGTLIWVISGIIVLLLIVFVFVFRGERKDDARVQERRTQLRQRARGAALGRGSAAASTDGATEGADGASSPDGEKP